MRPPAKGGHPSTEGNEPDDADIRREWQHEERWRRSPWRGGDVPVWAWSWGTWTKVCLWLVFAAPGFWLAFQVPRLRGGGEGFLQLFIMGAALVMSAVITEITWRMVGRRGRDLLRVGVFVIPLALFAALPWFLSLRHADITIDTPMLPFERVGWWLLGLLVAAIAVAQVGKRVWRRFGPDRSLKGLLALSLAAVLAAGAWYGRYRLTRPPLQGLDWRILTSAGPLPVARALTRPAAAGGCAALGSGWRLATRVELVTRSALLRGHGSQACFWVGPGQDERGRASCYAPSEKDGAFKDAGPTDSNLAVCMFDAPTGPR